MNDEFVNCDTAVILPKGSKIVSIKLFFVCFFINFIKIKHFLSGL